MIERIGISESDLHRLLDLVDPVRCGESGEFVPDSLLRDLAAAVGCDEVTYQVVDPYGDGGGGLQALVDDPSDDDPEVAELSRAAFWEAFCYPQVTGDFVTVVRSTDGFAGVARGPRWAAYHEACGGGPPLLAASVPLPPDGPIDHRMLLWRHDGSDFTDRDVALLALLRPHLVELHERHQRARNPLPELTPRQWEVLRLVAGGRTNTQIAHVLMLSEATVRKHLENIYQRLEVNSRTEALAKAGGYSTP